METHEVYLSGFVARYSQNPQMAWTGQTDGQHQWGVAVLLMGLFPDSRVDVLREALLHDTGERGACEASYPAKQKHPQMAAAIRLAELQERAEMGVPERTLTTLEWQRVKFCDRLESLLYAKVRAPWALQVDGWPELRALVLRQAVELGVLDQTERMV
jgi:5'-deoxynucleotidase YfbR-like HD superfamily hydrolase